MDDKPKNGRRPTTAGRYTLFRELIEEKGLSVKEAGKVLGLTQQGAYYLNHKLKKEGNQISKGMPDQLLRKMNRRAKQLLDGKAIGPDMKEVRCSTVAKLIEAGWARQYPTKQDIPAGSSFSFTQINLTEYRLDDTTYSVSPPEPDIIELSTDSSPNDNG